MAKRQAKHHHPDEKTKDQILVRLKRIEGQIRGIRRMIEKEAYCEDVLNQIASARSALDGARKRILRDHVLHCIADKMVADRAAATDELLGILQKVT